MGCCFQMMPHCLHRTSQLMRRCALSVEGGVCTMRWMHLDRLQRQDFFFFYYSSIIHISSNISRGRERGRERGRRAALCDSLVSSDTSLRKCFSVFVFLNTFLVRSMFSSTETWVFPAYRSVDQKLLVKGNVVGKCWSWRQKAGCANTPAVIG